MTGTTVQWLDCIKQTVPVADCLNPLWTAPRMSCFTTTCSMISLSLSLSLSNRKKENNTTEWDNSVIRWRLFTRAMLLKFRFRRVHQTDFSLEMDVRLSVTIRYCQNSNKCIKALSEEIYSSAIFYWWLIPVVTVAALLTVCKTFSCMEVENRHFRPYCILTVDPCGGTPSNTNVYCLM